jgi:predicted aspartyl protease
MGLFRVPGRLTGPTGRSETVELLVDTGTTLLVLPRDVAERLELPVLRTAAVRVAGGCRENWPASEVRLALEGTEMTTQCLIAASGPALLGCVPLESLFLAVDPVAKRLVPVEGFVG